MLVLKSCLHKTLTVVVGVQRVVEGWSFPAVTQPRKGPLAVDLDACVVVDEPHGVVSGEPGHGKCAGGVENEFSCCKSL